MSKGKIKDVFPGGNTSLGFFSYYDYILSQEEAQKIIIIKGGPGVGKSTFMKKIAEEMLDRGYDLEFMHCSSDNNSLDGVVIPALKVALIDGTAPHIVDPKNPGAVDEIIHLGDFWNEEVIKVNKENILRDNRETGRYFLRAYRYLKAAAAVYEDTGVINSWAMDNAKANSVAASLIADLFDGKGIAEREGKLRKLFASAITPNGLKNYLSTILTTGKVYAIKGDQGTGTEKLLEKIKAAAIERGFNVEAFYCPLVPSKLEHLLIPDMGVSFTTVNKYHDAGIKAFKEIDLNGYLDKEVLNSYCDELNYNSERFEELLNKAIATISKAKALHDKMEEYYIKSMDFEAVQRCWECTLARILDYIKD